MKTAIFIAGLIFASNVMAAKKIEINTIAKSRVFSEMVCVDARKFVVTMIIHGDLVMSVSTVQVFKHKLVGHSNGKTSSLSEVKCNW